MISANKGGLSMNLAFYGHTNSIVLTYTNNGIYSKKAILGGIRQMHHTATNSIQTQQLDLDTGFASLDETVYRKNYYGLRLYENSVKKTYYEISEHFGYEEGTLENNIFSDLPADGAPIDVLFVWDEGYGGLNPPESKNIFWASEKILPCREQFDKIASKCFLFLDGNVLRNAGAIISQQISWERTASDLLAEIQTNPEISYLVNARYLLISFGIDGAVFIIPNNGGVPDAALILTHGGSEGTLNNMYQNLFSNQLSFLFMASAFSSLVGGFSCLLYPQVAKCIDLNDFFTGLVNAMLEVWVQSNNSTTTASQPTENKAVKLSKLLRVILESGETILLIMSSLGAGLFDDQGDITSSDRQVNTKDWAAFPIPFQQESSIYRVPDDWTVINNIGQDKKLYDIAFEYVQQGAPAIEGLPQFALGNLTTVDRWEIESYQNIRNLILDYSANANSKRPLSIAVFGSPGSGKSFGVTEIATNILPGKVQKLEFNVSQFVSPLDLGVAFQKVRDVILEGKLPLVFFDEFDSDKDGIALGWIKSFLMPMQDGRFRDEGGEHPIGKCILVFAGGTAPNFEQFTMPLNNPVATSDVQSFKNIKGPDFISRLRGSLDVLGPNPNSKKDLNFILRRALLLRSLCMRDRRLNADGTAVLPVSQNIIHAMLMVPEYKHGARSMEAILDMSRIETGTWEPAHVPFHSQLALHVDADAFMRLLARA